MSSAGSSVEGQLLSSLSFIETQHARDRRKQRGIDKKDLEAALQYGTQTEARWGIAQVVNPDQIRITYKDIIYVVDKETKREVTCWAKTTPLSPVAITPTTEQQYDRVKEMLYFDPSDTSWWKSNTVLIVDTSGSMREADVWGCRSRLDAAWFSLALDFVAHRIESGVASAKDIVSVVTLSGSPLVVIKEEPCTWQLYNKLVKIYNNRRTLSAKGHGPYIPVFEVVKNLLERSAPSGCPLAVSLLSDGKPSDSMRGYSYDVVIEAIAREAGELARMYGRRLTFSTIGIGDSKEFKALEMIIDAVKDFGAHGFFQLPSMTSADLGIAFTTVSSSLTSTQTEQTDIETLKQHRVRSVRQESRSKAAISITSVSENDFHIYPVSTRVDRQTYSEYRDGNGFRKHRFDPAPCQHSDAHFIAFAKGPFGEGAERFAYRFYEVAEDCKTILGKALVAKESRYIEEGGMANEADRRRYIKMFCKTQQLARRLADEFNQKLDSTRRVHKDTPRVKFLDCSIYRILDNNMGKTSVLVEERLFGKWQKWNSNNGYVSGMVKPPEYDGETMRMAVSKLAESCDLDAIIEEESEEKETDSEAEDYKNGEAFCEPIVFSPFDVAQAFSHFSYMASGKKRLVCDLQGEYDAKRNILHLSDPVIHYHNQQNLERKKVHGRTDRGRKGMYMFFCTHRQYCGHLCRLVNRGFRQCRPRYQRTAPNRRDDNKRWTKT